MYSSTVQISPSLGLQFSVCSFYGANCYPVWLYSGGSTGWTVCSCLPACYILRLSRSKLCMSSATISRSTGETEREISLSCSISLFFHFPRTVKSERERENEQIPLETFDSSNSFHSFVVNIGSTLLPTVRSKCWTFTRLCIHICITLKIDNYWFADICILQSQIV